MIEEYKATVFNISYLKTRGEDEVPPGTFHGEDEVPPGTFHGE